MTTVDRRRQAPGYVHRIIKKKCKKQRVKRRGPAEAVPMPLQRLFVSCQDAFKGHGTVPSPADVQKLCEIIDDMTPEDVGLSGELPFFKKKTPVNSTPRVTCTTIYRCTNFSLCLFFLPANAVIPLHNHPGMTVFNKLLLGTMHIKSYDWVDHKSLNFDSVPPSGARLAKLKANCTFVAPCKTSVLYPTSGGNIHAFTAITPCAVLDVLGPPYSNEDGRDCSYYKDTPYSALTDGKISILTGLENDTYAWLEEIEMPPDSHMDGIEYLGPQIMESS